MRAFKIKAFSKWASGEGLSDDVLASAVVEMEKGLMNYTTAALTKAMKAGELIEIEVNDNG